MSRGERERLRDIRHAVAAIRAHAESRRDRDDNLVRDALLFQFVVIGEAVKNLSPETRDATPEVPWSSIAGLRDLIAHEYFRIETDRILAIIERDIPVLERAIERLLGE